MDTNELEKTRKGYATIFSFFLFGGIALIVVFFALFVINSDLAYIGVCFVILVITIVVPVVVYNLYSKKYRIYIAGLEKELLPEVNFNSNVKPNYQTFMSPKIFSVPDHYALNNYAESTYGGFNWFMHDYVLQRRERDRDGNVYYVTYARGKFYYFDFKREFNQTVRVIERSYFSNACINPYLEVIETEFVEFNKKFQISCSDPLTAFYILTPQIQEKIMEFEKYFGGSLYLIFQNSCLCVALDGVENYKSCNIYSSLNGKKINQLKQSILFPKLIIDSLKLSSDKFNSDKKL